MRQAEKGRKKFQSRIPFILYPGKKIPKKIAKNFKKFQKTTFRHYFQPKWDQIGRKREKKILVSNSVHTRPVLENFKTKNKKIQKMKKVYSSIISIENGLKEAEKDREKFQSRIPFILHPGKKITKKIQKIKKPPSGIIFSQNGMRQAEKQKKFSPEFHSYSTWARKLRKKQKKKIKKPLSSLFYSQNRMRKAEKEKKHLVPNSVHTRLGEENFEYDSK